MKKEFNYKENMNLKEFKNLYNDFLKYKIDYLINLKLSKKRRVYTNGTIYFLNQLLKGKRKIKYYVLFEHIKGMAKDYNIFDFSTTPLLNFTKEYIEG